VAGSPDPFARFERKSATRSFYGYNKHLATDADSEFFEPLVEHDAREMTADKGSNTMGNHRQREGK
jgi:hypothetical protein